MDEEKRREQERAAFREKLTLAIVNTLSAIISGLIIALIGKMLEK